MNLITVLVDLAATNGTGDPEDPYEQALCDVADRMGIDLAAALQASTPVLPPLVRTDLTPWRDAGRCPDCGAILAAGTCPDPECDNHNEGARQ